MFIRINFLLNKIPLDLEIVIFKVTNGQWHLNFYLAMAVVQLGKRVISSTKSYLKSPQFSSEVLPSTLHGIYCDRLNFKGDYIGS